MTHPTPLFVYIVQFSDDVIKVGRTHDYYNQRRKSIGAEARKRDVTVTREWVRPTPVARMAEWLLVESGRTYLTPAWGREYYRGDYDAFVALAESQLAALERQVA